MCRLALTTLKSYPSFANLCGLHHRNLKVCSFYLCAACSQELHAWGEASRVTVHWQNWKGASEDFAL